MEAFVRFGATEVPMPCKTTYQGLGAIMLQSFVKQYMSHIANLCVWVSQRGDIHIVNLVHEPRTTFSAVG